MNTSLLSAWLASLGMIASALAAPATAPTTSPATAPTTASATAARATSPSAPRPDILLIMPDQWRGDCLSAVGHPAVRTPTLDRLAREGALFRRAYSTIPSCIPARHALLTGQHPQTSGIVGFKGRPITVPVLPGLLAGAGYTTALVGRHMHQLPPDAANGYQQRIAGSTYVANDAYDTDLKQAAPGCGGILAVIKSIGVNTNGWEAAPWPLADDLHPTAWVARRTQKLINESPADRPLFVTASFYAPHSPLFPPRRFFEAYARMNLPPAARGDWVNWPAVPPARPQAQSHHVRLEGEALKTAQAGYFGLIEHLDEQIAPLIESFKARATKAGRPWLIVFTTDHGEMLGDHGLYRKCEPYEGSASIPFIVAGSADLAFKPGLSLRQPVCLEDLMPTLLELAGAARPQRIDGLSLLPLLRGQAIPLRPWLHLEHAPCYGKEQAFHALTDGRFKYIWRPHDGAEQLFDLEKDPHEEHNLAPTAPNPAAPAPPDPAHAQALQHWRTTLITRLKDRPEGFVANGHLIPARPYPPIQATPK